MKSCKYIQNAVYLAPDELRACCQRFHVNGVMKGDVVLGKLGNHEKLTENKILDLKEQLLSDINSGQDLRCDGCSYLIDKEWPAVRTEKLNMISIEDHSLCNMKCTYCSPTYYGNIPPQYDVDWDDLKGLIEEDCYFAWGGGEPTIRRDFEHLFSYICSDVAPESYHKIFTNSLTFSAVLEKLLAQGRVQIITSIDAGNEEVFKEIRGVRGIEKVFRNIQRYYSANPNGVTLKYILTNINSDFHNFDGFVKLISKYNLSQCPILISADFKTDTVSPILKRRALEFYRVLTRAKIGKIIFDDHFMKRSKSTETIWSPEISGNLPDPNKGFAICGTGTHSDLLTLKVLDRFPNADIVYVEKNPEIINKNERRVIGYKELQTSHKDFNVLIGSTTFAREILTRLERGNIDFNRIIPEIFLF